MVDSTKQVTIANGDVTDAGFKVPGEEPGDVTPFSTEQNEQQFYRWYIHIDNGFNQDIDVSVEGSHFEDGLTNDTLDSPATDGSTETISASTTDFFDGTTQHSYIQLNVDPIADPTSGTLTVTFQARKS